MRYRQLMLHPTLTKVPVLDANASGSEGEPGIDEQDLEGEYLRWTSLTTPPKRDVQ
jgi:hypothetical protein